jgi:hypothetical protein
MFEYFGRLFLVCCFSSPAVILFWYVIPSPRPWYINFFIGMVAAMFASTWIETMQKDK